MSTAIATIEDFLSQPRLALVGVSRDPKDLSRLILRELERHGHEIVAVTKQGDSVAERPSFRSVRDLPVAGDAPPVDGVIVMVPARDCASVVADCIAMHVPRVWIHRGVGAGSVSAAASMLAREHGLALVDGECPLMFLGGGVHAAHGTLRRLAGTYPTGGSRPAALALRIALAILQLIIGAAAVAAGTSLLANPSGAALGMTVALLASSPFETFLVPGIVLFVVNGLGQLTSATLVLRRRPGAERLSCLMGVALCGWIGFQWLWLGEPSWIQPLVFVIGAAQVALSLLLVRRAPSRITRLGIPVR